MKRKIIVSLSLVAVVVALISGCEKEGSNMPLKTNTVDTGPPIIGGFSIGEYYGGGIVFYLDSTQKHGLVMAQLPHLTPQAWNIGTPVLTHAVMKDYGWGRENTTAIVNVQGDAQYAANVCYKMLLNGYDDWFLPSKDELNALYLQKAAGKITNLNCPFYWSSTEASATEAWSQSFSNGANSAVDKGGSYGICPIRAF